MTSIYRPPSASRSLPPIPPEALERGRGKTRLNTDPDAYANRTPSGTVSISLPPIRSLRGSKDEGGPLPGISSIIDQSELQYERPSRRLSEAYPASPRDWDRVHSPSLRTPRMDSISTTEGSRPSSPDASVLSSSTSSLSSILEDRESCTSPGPIQLPRFLGSRLAQMGVPHSAFELSDLRTSLPSDEPRRTVGPLRTPGFRSPRSTPLPISRPMSPATQLSPHMRPLTHRLRSLAVTVGEDRVMDDTERSSTPSIKSEPETDSAPGSPKSKSISETDLFPHDEVLARSLVLDIQASGEQRDEQMACTPTQPDPKLPLPWMDTEPSTPTNRHSPLVHSPSPALLEDEDTKSGIIKQSDSETEEDPGPNYPERRVRGANTAVRTRGGPPPGWPMPSGFPPMPSGFPPMPMPMPEIAQLQQRAERYGFKLQPDPERQPTHTPSELLYQMAERQSHIERLQREQEEAATKYRMGLASPPAPNTWIDQPFGGMPIPEFPPPILPPTINFAPVPSIPPQQTNTYMSDLDYSFSVSDGYTDLTPTGLADYSGLSPPGLTAASSATSGSSPSDSFYLASPTPPSLSHGPSTRSTFTAQDPMTGLKQQDAMTFKLHDTLGFRPQDMVPEDEGFGHGSSTSVLSTTGSGTHKCQSCGKTFRRPSGLKDHMNIHSGEKPYCCPLDTCRKGFATRSNMIRHHNKTHPARPKIGGVADIGTDVEDVGNDVADPTSPAESSQSRFRVVQQSGSSSSGKEVGVGPVRGTRERRTMRKHTVSGPAPTLG